MLENVEKNKEEALSTGGIRGQLNELFTVRVLKAFAIILLLFFFQIASGINAVDFYSVDIFKSTGSNLNENMCAIVTMTVATVS